MQTIADQGAQVADGLAPVAHIVLDQDARHTVAPERREQHPGQAPALLEHNIEGIGPLGGESLQAAKIAQVRPGIEAAERDVVAGRGGLSPRRVNGHQVEACGRKRLAQAAKRDRDVGPLTEGRRQHEDIAGASRRAEQGMTRRRVADREPPAHAARRPSSRP